MSAGATAAANHSLKQNAKLQRNRIFLRKNDYRWNDEQAGGLIDTASHATKLYLQAKYQAEVVADRRNRRIGTLVGIGGVIIFCWLLGYFLG